MPNFHQAIPNFYLMCEQKKTQQVCNYFPKKKNLKKSFGEFFIYFFPFFLLGDVPDLNDRGVIIVNFSQYSRYRSVLKRVQGCENHWMHNSLIVSLGGFTTPTRKTYVLFCREIFDYAELEEHPYLCNHLGKINFFLGTKIGKMNF